MKTPTPMASPANNRTTDPSPLLRAIERDFERLLNAGNICAIYANDKMLWEIDLQISLERHTPNLLVTQHMKGAWLLLDETLLKGQVAFTLISFDRSPKRMVFEYASLLTPSPVN